MPPGSALYAREQIDGGLWEIAWLVREESARLARLGKRPGVEFRAGLYLEAGRGREVALAPVLVRVGPFSRDSVYVTWVNEYAGGGGGALEALANQARLVVYLYGDRCRLERTIAVSNRLAPFARQALAKVSALPPWGMADFDAAREVLYRRYPDVGALWDALGEGEAP
jgi:hypothetical protein